MRFSGAFFSYVLFSSAFFSGHPLKHTCSLCGHCSLASFDDHNPEIALLRLTASITRLLSLHAASSPDCSSYVAEKRKFYFFTSL